MECFRPLSWGLSFNCFSRDTIAVRQAVVFVPFLGDFLSIGKENKRCYEHRSFRPLSWGLSFNHDELREIRHERDGFRPLSWGLSFN